VKPVTVCRGVKLANDLHALLNSYTTKHWLLIILFLGPNMLGFADFDKHCMFGNIVEMAPD
jgi:hypothetical protein